MGCRSDGRRKLFQFLMGRFMSESPGPPSVSRVAWADLTKVSLAPLSIVFRARSGYACTFGVLRASTLCPLVGELRSRCVPMEPVRSSLALVPRLLVTDHRLLVSLIHGWCLARLGRGVWDCRSHIGCPLFAVWLTHGLRGPGHRWAGVAQEGIALL
jgi:hypothetical protein